MINLHGFHFWNSKLWPLVLMLLCLENTREKYFHSIFNSMGLSDLIRCYLEFKIRIWKRLFYYNSVFWYYFLNHKTLDNHSFDVWKYAIPIFKSISFSKTWCYVCLRQPFTFFLVWGLLFIFTEACLSWYIANCILH